ncbi:hypothetical protein KC19_9G179500 [Ceratodon purpureus]|uniref:Pyrrolo-quinoline quinone repeat domain-containing protein n=1 Tax=Ceratodon purpureus TaxID=3225 RepID=A0A8T0GXP2_CERPU|nr:hypothetical protein KC19_9G179500 [Ceratodon purpureus]
MAANGALACLLLTTLYWTSCLAFESFAQAKWPNHGGGIENLRVARPGGNLSPSTVANLKTKWRVKTTGDVTATPAIANGMVYFPTWDGELFAVKEKDGSILWRKNLTEVVGGSKTIITSRATPVVENKYLLVGFYGPALLIALHIQTGKLLWSTFLDANPYAVITMSGTVYESEYYVGISSISEAVVDEPCCTFQGSMVKVDIKTGKIKWRTKMVPDNGNKIGLYSGAAIWGSSPPIDCKRRMIYIATGNLYSTPPDVTECEAKQENKTVRDIPDPCISPDDHSESILALNLDSGRVVWAHQLGGYDTWVLSCFNTNGPQPNCPPIVGPDYDFAEAPMMLTTLIQTNMVAVGLMLSLLDKRVALFGLSSVIMELLCGIRYLDREVQQEDQCGE